MGLMGVYNMEFLVKRTSLLSDAPASKPTFDRNIYHKNINGVERWFIKFENLSDLLEFIKRENEQVVIGFCDGIWSIEIYDDYRE